MHVSDMTEPRSEKLQSVVISTKHPLLLTMMDLTMRYPMKSSSKGASEKRRLTQYVTNTTFDDNYKGTTEQFVFHFTEQFRQLEEISDPSEHFPPQIKLQLLQNAVRPFDDLRIVKTLDEFQSITTGYDRSSNLKY